MTKWTAGFLATALTMSFAGAALAGGAHGKCTEGTSEASLQARVEKMKAYGWLGVEKEKNAAGGYTITAVAPASPAAKAGFRVGDVLVALNGVALTDANNEALKKAKANLGPGKQVRYTLRRDGAEQQLTATLAEVPQEVLAQWLGEHLMDAHLGARVASN
ncbi:MAG TPA: PDZ domain-containing protein [Thermoanaerobaculia bacterium]|nr:PDZ domain-containing protein [Thermoanaerobaculia bacterium]